MHAERHKAVALCDMTDGQREDQLSCIKTNTTVASARLIVGTTLLLHCLHPKFVTKHVRTRFGYAYHSLPFSFTLSLFHNKLITIEQQVVFRRGKDLANTTCPNAGIYIVDLPRCESESAKNLKKDILRRWLGKERLKVYDTTSKRIFSKHPCHAFRHCSIKHLERLANTKRSTEYGLTDIRIESFKERKDVKSYLVSLNIIMQIGAVRDIILSETVKEAFDIVTAYTQQRTDDVAVLRLNATKSAKSGSTYQIEENRLDAVVTMMSHTNGFGSHIATQSLKIGVTQITCCHLYAHMMERSIFARVEMNKMKLDIIFTAKVFAEPLVTIRLLAT